MDALPTDVIEVILGKLAEQDPVSLSQAKCACKWLLHLAPAIDWRVTFLAPFAAEENVLRFRNCAELLDDQVASMGGHTRPAMVRCRYRLASKLYFSSLNKHTGYRPMTVIEGTMPYMRARLPSESVTRYLFVYKLRGPILSGTLVATRQSYLGRPENILRDPKHVADADSVQVSGVLTSAGKHFLGDDYEKMLKDWRREKGSLPEDGGKVGRKTIRHVVEGGAVSDLEIFVFLSPDTIPNKRECKPWDFRLSIKTKDNVYKLLVCRGKVYRVSREAEINRLSSKIPSAALKVTTVNMAWVFLAAATIAMLVVVAVWKFFAAA